MSHQGGYKRVHAAGERGGGFTHENKSNKALLILKCVCCWRCCRSNHEWKWACSCCNTHCNTHGNSLIMICFYCMFVCLLHVCVPMACLCVCCMFVCLWQAALQKQKQMEMEMQHQQMQATLKQQQQQQEHAAHLQQQQQVVCVCYPFGCEDVIIF